MTSWSRRSLRRRQGGAYHDTDDEHVIRTIQTGDVLTIVFEHPRRDTITIELDEMTMWALLGPLHDFRYFLEHRIEPFDLDEKQEPLPF